MVRVTVRIKGVMIGEESFCMVDRPGGHKERRVFWDEHALIPVV